MSRTPKIKPTKPDTQLEVEAKRWMRDPKLHSTRPPRGLAPTIARLKKQQKQAAEEAAKKVLELPNGEPNYEKLEKFLEAYLTNGQNVTQAALTIEPTASLVKAAKLGRYYYAMVQKYITQIQLEKQGWGHGKFMEILMKNMETSRKTDWWDRGMKLAGYEDFISPQKQQGSGNTVINIMGAQKKDMDDFGFGEEAVEGEIVNEQ